MEETLTFSRVFIPEDKITGYLLNLDSDDGKSKAKFFISTCGFSPDRPQELEEALRRHPLNAKFTGKRETEYGWNYVFTCDIQSPGRGAICIVSVWHVGQEGKEPSLVMARPLHEKERKSSGK